MTSKKNITLSNNHISQVTKKNSLKQIELRFKLLDACLSKTIKITDKVVDAIDCDKNLFELSGTFENIGDIESITRNTINKYGKLSIISRKRIEVKKIIAERNNSVGDNPVSTSLPPQNQTKNKQTKTSLKEENYHLLKTIENLSSELISLRTAYRTLLKQVEIRLPGDKDINDIINEHSNHSIIRYDKHLKVIK